jgi:hypothetical protein
LRLSAVQMVWHGIWGTRCPSQPPIFCHRGHGGHQGQRRAALLKRGMAWKVYGPNTTRYPYI